MFGDHPRSRGVYLVRGVHHSSRGGSSPLARGLLPPLRSESLGDRIIPARAGFTRFSVSVPRMLSDHPRSRGVYTSAEVIADDAEGSSPLARGLLHRRHPRRHLQRIIPARAGFTHLRILGIPTTSHTTRLRLPSLPT